MSMKISLQDPTNKSFGYIPRSGIAESYGDSSFDFVMNYDTVLKMSVFDGNNNSRRTQCVAQISRTLLSILSSLGNLGSELS